MSAATIECGVLQGPVVGSALVCVGGSRVFCSVRGPTQLATSEYRPNDGRIVCSVARAPFAFHPRRDPNKFVGAAAASADDDQFGVLLTGALERTVLLEKIPQQRFDVALDIVSSDGCEFVACTLAASAALAHSGIDMRDCLGAAVGIVTSRGTFEDVSDCSDAVDDPGSVAAGAMLVLGTVHSREVCAVQLSGDLSSEHFGGVIRQAMDRIADQRAAFFMGLHQQQQPHYV